MWCYWFGKKMLEVYIMRSYKMKEKIIKFKKGPWPKKYTAFIRNNKTRKIRKIHFGDVRYQQYKDRTPLKLYKKRNRVKTVIMLTRHMTNENKFN